MLREIHECCATENKVNFDDNAFFFLFEAADNAPPFHHPSLLLFLLFCLLVVLVKTYYAKKTLSLHLLQLMTMSNSGRLPSEEVQAANAKKMAQFQAQTETLKREQSSAKSQVMAVRKEELAKAAAQRQAMMGKIRAQMDGKTPFPGFRPGGGGGGGGDFSPSKTFAETMREKELKDMEKSKTMAANTSRGHR